MQARSDAVDDPFGQVAEAEKAIIAGNLEAAGLMMYQAVERAMVGVAKVRNAPHEDYDDLLHLAGQLDEEQGTPHLYTVPLMAARAMYDNTKLEFMDIEETLMSPDNARELISGLREFYEAA